MYNNARHLCYEDLKELVDCLLNGNYTNEDLAELAEEVMFSTRISNIELNGLMNRLYKGK